MSIEAKAATPERLAQIRELYELENAIVQELLQHIAAIEQWKEEDPRMLREQIRVADQACNHLVNENKKLGQALRLIADGSHRHGWYWMINLAREALGEQEQPTTKKEPND